METQQNNIAFFTTIPSHGEIKKVLLSEDFKSVPQDWHVVITDIVGSTKAIQSGKYKEVNSLNVAIISSILSLGDNFHNIIPFNFGGDGAALLIPDYLKDQAAQKLAEGKKLALSYGLDIRCCLVPVEDVRKDGYDIHVGKHQITETYAQAVFKGGGVEYAESLSKSTDTYNIIFDENGEDSLGATGFSCRWQPIPAKQGMSISLIVKSKVGEDLYPEILEEIHNIFGHQELHHPLTEENMTISLNPKQLKLEADIHKSNKADRLKTTGKYLMQNIKFRLNPELVKNNKTAIFQHSDYMKFDGSLKMVIGGNADQLAKFESYIEERYQNGEVYYGIHTSDSSLLTCMVFPNKNFEVHFVDGSDGGYAMAAIGLKHQLAMDKVNQ